MRLTNYLLAFWISSFLMLMGCSSDDENSSSTQEEWVQIQLKFENQFKDLSPIILNQTIQTSSNGQKHLFSKLQYIVSNIRLINTSGQEF